MQSIVGAVKEGVNKWGQTLLAQQDVNQTNGLPLRGKGLTPFVHTFFDRAYNGIGERGLNPTSAVGATDKDCRRYAAYLKSSEFHRLTPVANQVSPLRGLIRCAWRYIWTLEVRDRAFKGIGPRWQLQLINFFSILKK